jgi:hypothetical protein
VVRFLPLRRRETPLVDQADCYVVAAFPSQRETDVAAGLWRLELAVVVVERERQFIGFAPTLFDKGEFEEARVDLLGQISAVVEGEAIPALFAVMVRPCA